MAGRKGGAQSNAVQTLTRAGAPAGITGAPTSRRGSLKRQSPTRRVGKPALRTFRAQTSLEGASNYASSQPNRRSSEVRGQKSAEDRAPIADRPPSIFCDCRQADRFLPGGRCRPAGLNPRNWVHPRPVRKIRANRPGRCPALRDWASPPRNWCAGRITGGIITTRCAD